MSIMADATNTIAEGEVLQLLNAHDPETTEQRYLNVIYRKTAKLFEAGARNCGGARGRRPDADRKALAEYGRHVGTAFQLIDDVLDYRGSAEERGKNLGDDLAEGKPTLPLIHALKNGNHGAARSDPARRSSRVGSRSSLTSPRRLKRPADSNTRRAWPAPRPMPRSAHSERFRNHEYSRALRSLAAFAVERSH